jgi:hypothetical protein
VLKTYKYFGCLFHAAISWPMLSENCGGQLSSTAVQSEQFVLGEWLKLRGGLMASNSRRWKLAVGSALMVGTGAIGCTRPLEIPGVQRNANGGTVLQSAQQGYENSVSADTSSSFLFFNYDTSISYSIKPPQTPPPAQKITVAVEPASGGDSEPTWLIIRLYAGDEIASRSISSPGGGTTRPSSLEKIAKTVQLLQQELKESGLSADQPDSKSSRQAVIESPHNSKSLSHSASADTQKSQ